MKCPPSGDVLCWYTVVVPIHKYRSTWVNLELVDLRRLKFCNLLHLNCCPLRLAQRASKNLLCHYIALPTMLNSFYSDHAERIAQLVGKTIVKYPVNTDVFRTLQVRLGLRFCVSFLLLLVQIWLDPKTVWSSVA